MAAAGSADIMRHPACSRHPRFLGPQGVIGVNTLPPLLQSFFFLCLCLLWYPALFKCGSSEGRPHAEKCHQIYICFLFSSLGARNHTSPPSRRGAGTPLCTARLQGPSLGSACLQQRRPILASPPLQMREPGDQEQAGFAPLELTQSRFLSPALDSLAPCWGNCRSLICESSAKAVT